MDCSGCGHCRIGADGFGAGSSGWSIDLNATYPDLGGARFDLVLALDVLEHLVDPWTTLRLTRQHMSADGVIITSIPNIAHYSVVFPLFWAGAWDYGDDGLLDRTHLRFFTRRSALALLDQTGFAVQRVETIRRAPQVLACFGLKGQLWRWYNEKLLRVFLPSRLTDFQFLIAAKYDASR